MTYEEVQAAAVKSAYTVSSDASETKDSPTGKRVKIRTDDYRCAICMENFESADKLLLLPCQHYYHQQCTEGWLAVSSIY